MPGPTTRQAYKFTQKGKGEQVLMLTRAEAAVWNSLAMKAGNVSAPRLLAVHLHGLWLENYAARQADLTKRRAMVQSRTSLSHGRARSNVDADGGLPTVV